MPEDVVIVGGGPNGLLMAAELALHGVRPLVLEQAPEPSRLPKANGLIGQVVAALDHRGLYARLSGSDLPPTPAPLFQFGGLALDLSLAPDTALLGIAIPQAHLEEHLREHALALGARVLRGHRVIALTQDEAAVQLEVAGGGGEYELAARYVVAADGAHSSVRKALGVRFEGVTDDSFVARSAQVVFDPPVLVPSTGGLDIPGLGPVPPGFTRTETGVFAHLPLPGGDHRFVLYEWGRPPTTATDRLPIEELRSACRRVLGTELPMRYPAGETDAVVHRRTVGTNSRQAEQYRVGRVLLVGDAAHVQSGIGGPGLNLGMLDVFNLGWKLAAVGNGHGGDTLLDTYHSERHPVGARVLMQSRAQLALLAPGPNVTALRQVVDELLADGPAVRRITRMLTGADTRYPMPGGDHPLTGTWVPDLPLTTDNGTTRVAELFRAARPVLLVLSPGRHDHPDGWRDRLDVVTASTPDPPAAALLIRPDGYVAWATDADDPDGLVAALLTWLGPRS
ncbi:FAD-dependent monooxygenase [Pseudonocardia spinosispora]|uniref:FAD-dependent monooxygenase n=1 Tax=Pseudonocardia spinosispora TaxID=103441 RepID=UPI000401B616|nr:FAD-dependent monooxygenase [Pseudonocardia spinosispora]